MDVVPLNQPLEEAFAPEGEQVVLILSGLIGSGKSAFAQALEKHIPHFVRCNQDELGSRKDVEDLARHALDEGRSVCIDRTNVDADQRAHWIRIAHRSPGVHVWLIVFDIPIEVCAERLKHRTSHPTIHTPEKGLEVLTRFAHQFRHPQPYEGYDRIQTLTLEDQPENGSWNLEELEEILQRLRDSPQIDVPAHNQGGRGRGAYRRSYNRGRGRGWWGAPR
ncbi:P-loop containing nucleoside triphosphate hydrolase protein [Flagelloscypha sp. PMI_526]|nr:P-loop containing nucleoside triphosphate hydrolase protein [Flagelloscypha sp. PMI_526]